MALRTRHTFARLCLVVLALGASRTGAQVTAPAATLTPSRSAESSASARFRPLLAIASTYGRVTLVRPQVEVIGTAPGITRLELEDNDGGKEVREVLVHADVEYLNCQLRKAVPLSQINVIPNGVNSVILTGYVHRAEDITVVELLWARSLLVSQVALAELQGGAE